MLCRLLMPMTIALGCASANAETPEFEDGDIILHQSQSQQSTALQKATGSPYTHTGLVFNRQGGTYVLEAVEPVQWTSVDKWIARGKDKEFIVLRLKDPSKLDENKLRQSAESYLGLHYDALFEWSDSKIYCSELVYKAYAESNGVKVGTVQTLGSFELTSPEVKALIEARAKRGLNLEEPVVSPASFLTDPSLQVVYSTDPHFPHQPIGDQSP